jgi:hypothetical protein
MVMAQNFSGASNAKSRYESSKAVVAPSQSASVMCASAEPLATLHVGAANGEENADKRDANHVTHASRKLAPD